MKRFYYLFFMFLFSALISSCSKSNEAKFIDDYSQFVSSLEKVSKEKITADNRRNLREKVESMAELFENKMKNLYKVNNADFITDFDADKFAELGFDFSEKQIREIMELSERLMNAGQSFQKKMDEAYSNDD